MALDNEPKIHQYGNTQRQYQSISRYRTSDTLDHHSYFTERMQTLWLPRYFCSAAVNGLPAAPLIFRAQQDVGERQRSARCVSSSCVSLLASRV